MDWQKFKDDNEKKVATARTAEAAARAEQTRFVREHPGRQVPREISRRIEVAHAAFEDARGKAYVAEEQLTFQDSVRKGL
jgi:hypothetical protein